jgi:hypothetical protein
MMSSEEAVTELKAVSLHFPGGTEEDYEKPQDHLYADILYAMQS